MSTGDSIDAPLSSWLKWLKSWLVFKNATLLTEILRSRINAPALSFIPPKLRPIATLQSSLMTSSLPGGNSQHGQNVRFVDQRSNRIREWARLYNVRYPQEDKGLSTGPQPTSSKSIPGHTFAI
ncbi:hypothetical protein BGZ54_001674 [Gamsiella multidivaricata]|nr:hypothetical protein BGZ54_001674 [Gamsiella multidivaricata]